LPGNAARKSYRVFVLPVAAGIAFQDLYLGATVNVYSRELVVVDYGDEFTKGQLEQKKEKTLALIKPDAFLKVGKVRHATSVGRCRGPIAFLPRAPPPSGPLS
jgi:RecB family exonuclease